MSQQSFADLGVSDAVVRALAARGVTAPFDVQRSVVPDALAGHDVLVQSPTGSGKTLAFGVPLVDRVQAEDARAAALVLVPTRELASQVTADLREIAEARALSLAAVYGGAGIERQAKLARRAHILVATPGRLEDLVQRGAIDSIPYACWCSTRRTGCSTWASARPSTASSRSPRATARRSSSPPRSRARPGRSRAAFTRNPRRHEQQRQRAREGARGAPLRRRRPRVEARLARQRAGHRRARAHARVRAHQARRRPAGQAPVAPRRARAGDPRQPVAVPAREGARPLPLRARSTRWSPPTWPPAASTWTTSRT